MPRLTTIVAPRLRIAAAPPPEVISGSSFLNVLTANKEGLVDPDRSWVITGRERHVAAARTGKLPYPQRALRTQDHLYIINFKPDRWSMGNPYNITDNSAPAFYKLANETYVTYRDLDARPTTAWLVRHRNDPKDDPA